MSLHPVILCGGGGTRLWPASRPERPKPFLALTGEMSLFQQTALRLAPLASEGRGPRRLLVVGGQAHAALIHGQLAAAGVEADVLLEPEGRDSAAAMAAAAVFVLRRDPDAVLAVFASDHFIADDAALRAATLEAAQLAQAGRIVTLGVRPNGPSSAYGYILPETPDGAAPVSRFVEKPDRTGAVRLIGQGALWNSGNFIAPAGLLLDEITRFAPQVSHAAEAAVDGVRDGLLSSAFLEAPAISIDYAVMENTDRAWVTPVDFAWSDLGVWGAIHRAGGARAGQVHEHDCADCLVRAAPGMTVAATGLHGLAVVAEPDALLVCALETSAALKPLIAAVEVAADGLVVKGGEVRIVRTGEARVIALDAGGVTLVAARDAALIFDTARPEQMAALIAACDHSALTAAWAQARPDAADATRRLSA